MFSLTRKSDYALVALARLAEQQEAEGPPMSARQIADQYDLPPALLMNILKDLQRAGIVTSARGARGGYALAEPAEQIPLARVIDAIEGVFHLTQCSQEGHPPPDDACRVLACPVQGPLRRLQNRFNAFLNEITLKDLLARHDQPANADAQEANTPA